MDRPVIHYISSDSALSGTGSNFTFPMTIPSRHNRVSLVSAQIPKTFYLVRTGENTFYFTKSGILVKVMITIPVGLYSVSEFVTAFNAACNASGSGTGQVVATVAYSSRTSKFTFTAGAWAPTHIQLYNRMGRVLGFPVDRVGGNPLGDFTDTYYDFSAGTLESTICLNFTLTSTVWIQTNICVETSPQAFGSTLSSFYTNDTPDQAYITYVNPCPMQTPKQLATFNPVGFGNTVQAVQFVILDDEGEVIDLNGHHVELVLLTWHENDTYGLLYDFFRASLEYMREQRLRQQNQDNLANQNAFQLSGV